MFSIMNVYIKIIRLKYDMKNLILVVFITSKNLPYLLTYLPIP